MIRYSLLIGALLALAISVIAGALLLHWEHEDRQAAYVGVRLDSLGSAVQQTGAMLSTVTTSGSKNRSAIAAAAQALEDAKQFQHRAADCYRGHLWEAAEDWINMGLMALECACQNINTAAANRDDGS